MALIREWPAVRKWTSLVAATALLGPLAIAQPAETAVVSETSQPVIVEADNIYQDENSNTVIAEGSVQASYEGRILKADKVIYNRDTERVHAIGNVVIVDPDGSQRFAREVEVDSNLSDGYAVGFSTRLPNGGIATANSAIRQSDGISALDQIVYTACELCEDDDTPTWSLRARKAVLDDEAGMYSYRDAVLEVAGIPVFYIPYFSHPDPNSERRSGLLAPSFGTSSKLGVFYQQPYYLAISESQDLTISPKVMVNANPLLQLNYRKRFWSGEIDIDTSFTYDANFDSDGDKFGEDAWRSHIYASGLFNITNNLQWGFGLERQNDDLYTRRYDIEGENRQRGLYDGQPRRMLSQLYLTGQDSNYYFDVSLMDFQGLRANDNDAALPLVSPLFYGERLFDFGRFGNASLNASSAILTRSESSGNELDNFGERFGADSQRVSFGGDWSMARVLPGGLVLEPFAEARADYYVLDSTVNAANPDLEGPSNVSRVVGSAGARLSYPLIRPGKTVDILIEPTVMAALGSSNSNDSSIPVEDSLLYEFDESRLFEANASSGYDLYDGGNKIAAGLTATARWKNGVEVSGIVGRRWRDQADPVFDFASNLGGTQSDWVAGVSADFGRPLRLETRFRFGDDNAQSGYQINRIDARLTSNWNRLRGSVRYYRLDGGIAPANSVTVDADNTGDTDEGIDIRAEFKLTDSYSLVYGRKRDIGGSPFVVPDPITGRPLLDADGNEIIANVGRDLLHRFGVAYEDDCSRFEIAYERSEALDRTLGPNDSIKFRFSLKTLGDFGTKDLN